MEARGMIERVRLKDTSLDSRIGQALGNGKIATDDLQQLLQEIEDGIRQHHQISERERARSLDPGIAQGDAEAAVQQADAAVLKCRRYATALVRLRERLADQVQAERCDKWQADASKVAARVEAAATQLKRYPELASQIVAILAEIEEANKEVSNINGRAPDGVHRRLGKIDLSHLSNLVLPDPAHPGRKLWPVETSLAVAFVQAMGTAWSGDPRQHSAEWWKVKPEQQEREREQQQRQAEALRRMTVEQERRQNDEERERFAQAQRRS
jgi:hypothetical protein